MELSYKARYYDGQSTKPFTVDITLLETGIELIYTDYENTYHKLFWERAQIKEADLSAGAVILRYGDAFPYQQLEVTDQQFIRAYRSYAHIRGIKRWAHFPTFTTLSVLVLAFIGMMVATYLWVLPFATDQVAKRFPVEYEVKIGNQMFEGMLQDAKIDSSKSAAINGFFRQLHIETQYPVRIVVVSDSVVNAFAMPGGNIVVYDAILTNMKHPNELAALLGHEFSHVQLKHVTRNIFRTLGSSLFISVIFSDANGIMNLIIENAQQLKNLSYSRELEHEADENGLAVLKQNRLSPIGMINLFKHLKEAQPFEVDETLSTHPDLDSRIDFARQFKQEHPYQEKVSDSLQYYFELLQQPNASW